MDYNKFLSSNYKMDERIAKMYINNPKQGTKTYFCTVGNLAEKSYSNEINTYMSYNPVNFKQGKINRDKDHVSSLKWNYIDLDFYHSEYNGLSQEQILWLLEQDYFGRVLPFPTYIINSGRGMYLFWKIDEHIKALPRWEKVQKYFYDVLKEFGADAQIVTDTSRVFRVLGSINSKSNTEVKVMQYNNVKYCLSNIIREYLPTNEPSEKMVNYAESIARTLDIELPDMNDKQAIRSFIGANKGIANLVHKLNKVKKPDNQKVNKKGKICYFGNESSLLQARLKDLETLLLKHRDKESGYREYILFLYRYWNLCINEDKLESLNNTLKLNRKLTNPLNEKEVICATKSAERYFDQNKCFRLKNKKLIEILKITINEMKDMKTIISNEMCVERKRERNKKAYLERLKNQGKNTKAEDIKERLKAIYILLQQGKRQLEICEILHISKSTFFNEKKKLECLSDAEISEMMKAETIEITNNLLVDINSPKNSAFDINKTFRSCFSLARSLSLSYLDYDVGWLSG